MVLLQGGKIRGIDQIIRQRGVFQQHHQVDGVVGDLAVDTDVAVVEHIGFGDGVGGVLQEIVQGGVLVIALSFCLVNLVVDILYAYVDPRVRSQYK